MRCRRGWRHKCTDSRRGELKLRLGHAPATAVRGPASQMVLLEPRTLRLLAVRSNQLSCETDAPVYTPQDKTRAAGQLQPRRGEHLDEVSGPVCKAQARANALFVLPGCVLCASARLALATAGGPPAPNAPDLCRPCGGEPPGKTSGCCQRFRILCIMRVPKCTRRAATRATSRVAQPLRD